MAKKKAITGAYEALPKIVKIILQLFFGIIIGGVYRIIRYFETKKVSTLVAGILLLFTVIGNVFAWIIDIITQITSNRITFLAK